MRICLYGDETIAYYTAHVHKDMRNMDDDNVLDHLTSDAKATTGNTALRTLSATSTSKETAGKTRTIHVIYDPMS